MCLALYTKFWSKNGLAYHCVSKHECDVSAPVLQGETLPNFVLHETPKLTHYELIKSKHYCNDCCIGFKTKNKLIQHMLRIHQIHLIFI